MQIGGETTGKGIANAINNFLWTQVLALQLNTGHLLNCDYSFKGDYEEFRFIAVTGEEVGNLLNLSLSTFIVSPGWIKAVFTSLNRDGT